MFTGLIERIGTVTEVQQLPGEFGLCRLGIATPWQGDELPAIGASVAIEGTCLTVTKRDPPAGGLTFEVAAESQRRTTLGALRAGSKVHLERALRFGDRLDGHLVSGHVDGIGRVVSAEQDGSAWVLHVAAPKAVLALSSPQGAVTLAGVSLTVVDVKGDTLSVSLVPHTMAHTTLGSLQPGDSVNCEADLLARYIARLLPPGANRAGA